MYKFHHLIIPFLCLCLCGTAFSQRTEELGEAEERRVLPGDRLRINLEEDADINGLYPVAGDGTIDLVELGRVNVADRTIPEAEQAVGDYLESRYFKQATVTLSIDDFVKGEIRVTGPGIGSTAIQVSGDNAVTLFEAIVTAGGLRPRSDASNIKILRWKPGGGIQRQVITIDVQQMFDELDFTNDEYLRPRDVVYVPVRRGDSTKEILYIGDVGAVGYHPWYEGMNILRLVANTGGVAKTAQADAARILRPQPSGDYLPIPVNLTILLSQGDMSQNKDLKAGDIVYVPAKELATRGSAFALGAVAKRGPIPLPLNTELTVARAMLNIGFAQYANQKKVRLIRKLDNGDKHEIFVNVKEILDTGNFEDDVPLQEGDMIMVDELFILSPL